MKICQLKGCVGFSIRLKYKTMNGFFQHDSVKITNLSQAVFTLDIGNMRPFNIIRQINCMIMPTSHDSQQKQNAMVNK